MTKSEYNKLINDAASLRGKRRNRFLSSTEVNHMRDLDRKSSLNGKKIRIYSDDGFVPNSYKYNARIDYIERWYDENGKKHFSVGQTGASRSHGNGALCTVDNRAYCG